MEISKEKIKTEIKNFFVSKESYTKFEVNKQLKKIFSASITMG